MKNGKSMKRIMIKIGNMIGRGLGLRRAPVFQGLFFVFLCALCYNICQRSL